MTQVETTFRISQVEVGTSLAQYLLYRRHLFAYQQALKHSQPGRRCLDLACGNGYALPDLLEQFGSVIAIDLATAPLKHLTNTASVSLLQCDATNLSLKDESVDVALAFQLIEHMPRGGALRVIREMQRVLKKTGVGFLTTPNARWRLLPGQRPWNPYHTLEYYPQSIRDLALEADIPESSLSGIVGINGAQEVEQARVHQDWLTVRFGKVGHALRWLLSTGTVETPGARQTRQTDQTAEWFELSQTYEDGLDFWIEIRP